MNIPYEIGCKMQKKRIECAIALKADENWLKNRYQRWYTYNYRNEGHAFVQGTEGLAWPSFLFEYIFMKFKLRFLCFLNLLKVGYNVRIESYKYKLLLNYIHKENNNWKNIF